MKAHRLTAEHDADLAAIAARLAELDTALAHLESLANRRAEPAHEPATFSINDAASRLGISRRTIYRMLADGTLKSITISSQQRIPRSELDRISTPDAEKVA